MIVLLSYRVVIDIDYANPSLVMLQGDVVI